MWRQDDPFPSARFRRLPVYSRRSGRRSSSPVRDNGGFRNRCDKAEALLVEIIADARDRLIAIDFETAPSASETARLRALELQLIEVRTRISDRRYQQQAAELRTELNRLVKENEYARRAGLDPQRSRVRLCQLYGGTRGRPRYEPHTLVNPWAALGQAPRGSQRRLRAVLSARPGESNRPTFTIPCRPVASSTGPHRFLSQTRRALFSISTFRRCCRPAIGLQRSLAALRSTTLLWTQSSVGTWLNGRATVSETSAGL